MAEGGFNKVFLLTIDDGSEVVARIPTPIAGPRGLTTASEVATMRFLRETLHIPVPRVLAYSPTSDNPVGAEYILMERLRGEALGPKWLSLSKTDMVDLMTQIARIEKKIFDFKFPAYGSLYHRHDIPKESRVDFEVDGGDFCIGPICKRQFWHGERADMELDRGPWTSPADCVSAPARRELACTSTFGKPRPRRAFLLPTEENIDPREHISLLSQYLQVAPFLVPAQQEMATPILRHPDLSFPNILLTPGTNKIEGILDWQDASILPLFMQAGYPAFCEHNYFQVQSLKEPNLPNNYGELNDVDRMKADIKLQLEKANLYYYAATGLENDLHLRALRLPGLGMIQYLISHAGYPWDADLINFRAGLVGLTKIWDGMISDPCPISFSPDDEKAILNDATEWRECEEILLNIQENIGVDREGGTHPDDFEHAYEMAQRLRLQIYANAEEKLRKLFWKSWIFKDDGDNSPLLYFDLFYF
ncbi:Mitochondria protein Fmp29 [Trichophyton interdigitale]|uniref:Mitochondria protein Fmp29 n=1 Tax=Trichophyton interdigitale TaxID=101480 RepID=A0A9P4YPM1_9EURO|nr:Mitochondria protein Fmp29 [Trichophyton interdigitale]KAF3900788.1 Mitochondria protein Fmp29 [Trichophyton interdigitale]KAG8211690.1 Mitochondria protein Fmp29 [Trichophyton interdigitale]